MSSPKVETGHALSLQTKEIILSELMGLLLMLSGYCSLFGVVDSLFVNCYNIKKICDIPLTFSIKFTKVKLQACAYHL